MKLTPWEQICRKQVLPEIGVPPRNVLSLWLCIQFILKDQLYLKPWILKLIPNGSIWMAIWPIKHLIKFGVATGFNTRTKAMELFLVVLINRHRHPNRPVKRWSLIQSPMWRYTARCIYIFMDFIGCIISCKIRRLVQYKDVILPV